MSTILVTGGHGFTGRYIVERLVRAGYRVVSYNRDYATSGDAVIQSQGELFDVGRLTRVMQDYSVAAVVHTAGVSHPTLSIDFPMATFAANVDGTLGVLEAMRLAGVFRLVNFSSETVYGAVDGLVTEDTPVKPSTPYAVTKVTTEWLGHVYQVRYGLEVVSLRIAQVYGPGNRMPEILGDLLKSAVKTGAASLHQGGDHGFNFIHAYDVALVTECALAARGPFPLRAYNVSSQEYWRMSDVLEVMRKIVPEAAIEIGPGLVTELDLQGPFDCSAALRDLGYAPAWRLEKGLAHYAEWLEDHEV